MANTKISAFTAETDVANITGFAAFKTVGGSSTNVKISGSEIESTLNLSNFAVGTLAVDRGGTGQTSYTDGQLLIGNTTGNTLAKATLTASTGISITNGNGSISITNSAPDQTVALTGGTGISTSGTYPNFTITNDSPNQATPAAGSSGQLQYNDGSNGFTATSDMVYTTDQLKVQNTLYLDGNGPAGGGSGNAGIVKLGCEATGASHYVGLEGPTHAGSNSYIIQQGTGDLIIENKVDDKDIIFKCDDGSGGLATYFYLDGSADLNRFTKNVMYNDNVVNYFGGGFDLQIFLPLIFEKIHENHHFYQKELSFFGQF